MPPGGETRRLKKKLYTSIMKRTITWTAEKKVYHGVPLLLQATNSHIETRENIFNVQNANI